MMQRPKPTTDQLMRLRERMQGSPYSYAPIGGTQGPPPPNYTFARRRGLLGQGSEIFYEVSSFSRAYGVLSWLGRSIVRQRQEKFRQASLRTLQLAVAPR